MGIESEFRAKRAAGRTPEPFGRDAGGPGVAATATPDDEQACREAADGCPVEAIAIGPV